MIRLALHRLIADDSTVLGFGMYQAAFEKNARSFETLINPGDRL
ncbi:MULTISPECIES: hypothetical protein [Sphingomonas]|nr:hypothetical protein [Sphingomonas sp. ABOLF]